MAKNLLIRGTGLPLLFLLTLTGATAQRSGAGRTKAPSMSSDDLAGAPSTKPHIVESKPGDGTPAGWKRYSLEDCGLSISLPSEPLTVDMPVGDQITHLIVYSKNHLCEATGYFVLVSHSLMGIQTPIRPLAEAWIKGVADHPDLSNFKYNIGSDKSSGRVPVKGSYSKDGALLAFEGFAELNGNHFWFVVAVHQQSEKSAAEEARKALASAAFDGPECPDQ